MYSVQVEYHTEDHLGNVRKRTERLILAIQPGEKIITTPKTVVIMAPPQCAPAVESVDCIPTTSEPSAEVEEWAHWNRASVLG